MMFPYSYTPLQGGATPLDVAKNQEVKAVLRFHESGGILKSGWKLVRRVQAGNAWHPATDRCEGSEVYNADQVPTHSTSTADVTFSLNFEETVPEYDELMFATGDCKVWLITTKDAVGGPLNGEYYEDAQRKILSSSEKSHPYTAIWKNDEANPDDPWISVVDHGAAIGAGMLVYGENSFDAEELYTKVLQDHNGANVFVRKNGSFPDEAPRSSPAC
jgi:hypothetical protein